MATKILFLSAAIGILQMASSDNAAASLFATDLFKKISKGKTNENVILSPVSIQTSLAMTYLGAEGETATELEKGLRLPSSDKEEVGKHFAEILKEKKGAAQLSIANRLYVNSNNQLTSTFNERAKKYFKSEAETMDFSQSSEAIETINAWIETKTNNKITNLLQPGSVDGDTSAVLVNAIYFKGKWQTPFSDGMTRKFPFWVSATKSVEVDTMYGDERFKYAELPDLDATAIEMPYKDSPISMLVILPNERDGLAKLEESLSTVDINSLSSKMVRRSVEVRLPKFRIEFSVGLIDPLKAIGIKSIFGDSANLSGIFESGPSAKVSDVQHKAFIDVNEAGSEATAATIVKYVTMSLDLNTKDFNVNHPFVFAIKSPEAVYFVGHVATF